jgi:hypothetical protein
LSCANVRLFFQKILSHSTVKKKIVKTLGPRAVNKYIYI